MKKLISVCAVMIQIATFPVFASVEVDTRGLSDSQKATLVQQVEQMKQQDPYQIVPGAGKVADVADKWVNIGERFGKMFGGAAKEIGMATNDFLKTPVGMMTAGVIIFNYVGSPIIHVVLGLLILFIGLAITLYFQSTATKLVIKYDNTSKTWWGGYNVLEKNRDQLNVEYAVGLWISYFVIFVVSIWVMFAW
jgi:hypothetical protein